MPEFVRVKLLQVDFGAQSPARDPYCSVSIKEAVPDNGESSNRLLGLVSRVQHTRKMSAIQCRVRTFVMA